jgi:NAD(P)-dependent dehydrogenase (short-subunit alcohol dehydrogenase family)
MVDEAYAVLVTGASRGIGRAIAIELAKDGFDIGVHYYSNKEGAQEVVNQITSMGRMAIALNADVGQEDDVKKMISKFTDEFSRVFGVVNNAGVYERKPFPELTFNDWDRTIRTNLTSMYLVTHELLPHITENGRIVNLSSVLAHRGSDFGAHYAATKAGIIGFSKSLARELGKKRITVNAVAPGAIETQIIAGDSPEKRKQREKLTPLNRVGQPEEIAATVSFLFSNKGSYITGETINVNGGMIMH